MLGQSRLFPYICRSAYARVVLLRFFFILSGECAVSVCQLLFLSPVCCMFVTTSGYSFIFNPLSVVICFHAYSSAPFFRPSSSLPNWIFVCVHLPVLLLIACLWWLSLIMYFSFCRPTSSCYMISWRFCSPYCMPLFRWNGRAQTTVKGKIAATLTKLFSAESSAILRGPSVGAGAPPHAAKSSGCKQSSMCIVGRSNTARGGHVQLPSF